PAPTVDAPRVDDGARVGVARIERGHAAEAAHVDGGRAVDRRPVPELAVRVRAPARDGAVAEQGAGEGESGRDGACRARQLDGHGPGAVGQASVAELAVAPGAPAAHRAV